MITLLFFCFVELYPLNSFCVYQSEENVNYHFPDIESNFRDYHEF